MKSAVKLDVNSVNSINQVDKCNGRRRQEKTAEVNADHTAL